MRSQIPAVWAVVFAALLLPSAAIARSLPPARPYERFDACHIEPDKWTDGDSFRVRLPDGRLETFCHAAHQIQHPLDDSPSQI